MTHSSIAYLASLVLRSVGCFSVFLTACLAWWKLRGITVVPLTSSSSTSVNVTGSSYLPASTVNRLLALAIALNLFGIGTTTWILIDRFARPDRVTLENVHVLSQLGTNEFTMEVQSKPGNGDWRRFAATFCPDSYITPEIRPGVTLLVLAYKEDAHLGCFDVRQPNGYVLWRDEHNAPIISSFPRSSTACPCSSTADTGPETEARSRPRR